MTTEHQDVYGNLQKRPPTAQATVALMWSGIITSMGSTMMAVAGLAMAAGYHESHTGLTMWIAKLHRGTRQLTPTDDFGDGETTTVPNENDNLRNRVSLLAAEVSVRVRHCPS